MRSFENIIKKKNTNMKKIQKHYRLQIMSTCNYMLHHMYVYTCYIDTILLLFL